MRRVLVLAGFLVACGHPDPGPIDPVPDGATVPYRCLQIEDQLKAAVAERGSCTSPTDCTLVGGQQQVCDCGPYVLDPGGMPIEKNAPQIGDIRALTAEYWQRGCRVPSWSADVCDAAPNDQFQCISGRCVGSWRAGGCFPQYPDAGV